MSKLALIYSGSNVTGFVFCSQDADLAAQAATHIEVATDHAAVTNPTGWEVVTVNGVPSVHVR